jgi:hypothetical protein
LKDAVVDIPFKRSIDKDLGEIQEECTMENIAEMNRGK